MLSVEGGLVDGIVDHRVRGQDEPVGGEHQATRDRGRVAGADGAGRSQQLILDVLAAAITAGQAAVTW